MNLEYAGDSMEERSGHPGARNPKTKAFSVKVTDDINTRVERLSDAAGTNKSVMAAILMAAGLRQLEAIFLMQQVDSDAVQKFQEEQLRGMEEDIKSVSPPGFIK